MPQQIETVELELIAPKYEGIRTAAPTAVHRSRVSMDETSSY